MLSSPSLCPLFPSTIHICQLDGETRFERLERCQSSDRHRCRVHRNIALPLNSSRLPLNPDHIATQLQEQCHITAPQDSLPPSPTDVTCRPASTSDHSIPTPPTSLPPSRRNTTSSRPLSPTDTRR